MGSGFKSLIPTNSETVSLHVFLGEALAKYSKEGCFSSEEIIPEFGYQMMTYLGRRVALEHVFFGRRLHSAQLSLSQLKSEVWRIQKLKAKPELT